MNSKDYNYKTYCNPNSPLPCSDTDAANNWWGTTDESKIQESIYDYSDDWDLYEVIYTPWLTELDPNVPASSSSSSTTSSSTDSTTSIITTTTMPPPPPTTTSFSSSTTTTPASSCPSEQIYGEHSEQTELLRFFRDNVLNQSPEGQGIIRLYYEWSPAIVKAMEQDEEFRTEVKGMVDGVLELIGGVE